MARHQRRRWRRSRKGSTDDPPPDATQGEEARGLRVFDVSITPACQQRGNEVAQTDAMQQVDEVVRAQLARKGRTVTVTVAVEVTRHD